ncbi:ABC transporter permease [Helicobacter mastomyrinus]|uniref:ABC transporter permease n=1 Tax=Helicobacter mastomyrinus TaxID=287948 RepID=A0ABZ3F1T7_9HELI
MSFEVKVTLDRIYIELQGRCDYTLEKKSQVVLRKFVNAHAHITLDFTHTSSVDFVFCSFMYGLLKDKDFEMIGVNSQIEAMFALIKRNLENSKNTQSSFSLQLFPMVKYFFMNVGKKIMQFYETCLNFLQFCGTCLWYFSRAVVFPHRFKINSIFYHINESGFKALPVALLTAFIVSYAIALQGVLQLEKMGAPLMSVEIVAKLSLREMGPFILAIVIAGRSASSFSAQLGVMNLTEENDALKTMNLSLYDYLILPRILALVIIMPLLVFVADAVSLFAAMLAVKMQTGISFVQYLERFYEYVGINNFWVGVVKAPFFGAAIALVGCFRGLYVKGDTESIGLETTKSVVNALFWVILINAIFSVITTRLNV